MAGGLETRFGPINKYLGSKTSQKINGRDEILVETIKRCNGIISKEDIFIITNKEQKLIFDRILNYTDEKATNYFQENNYIIEPEPRGTAPCILYAALTLEHKYCNEETIMCVFPSDHDIPNDPTNIEMFQNTLNTAICAAHSDRLITIGIHPTFAATAYGYIAYSNQNANELWSRVDRFKEKPDKESAEIFIATGRLWNSGIFIWKTSVILQKFEQYFKEGYYDFHKVFAQANVDPTAVARLKDEAFIKVKKTSIDYAILEHAADAGDLLIVKGGFVWQDIGKWDALIAVFSKSNNIIDIDLVGVDLGNKTIYSTGKHVYRKNNDFTFNFTSDSYVWLYCDVLKKGETIALLKDYDFYENISFKSIEVDWLQMQASQKEILEKELEYQHEFQKKLNEYFERKANHNYTIRLALFILSLFIATVCLFIFKKTISTYILGSITIISFFGWLFELFVPKFVEFTKLWILRENFVKKFCEKERKLIG